MANVRTALLLLAFALWCWTSMLLVHESGHLLAAWITGARVTHLTLHPGVIPSTLVRPNPSPSVVLWGGFVSGLVVPGIACACAWCVDRHKLPVFCWAAFCWLAQGAYLAAGGVERYADTAQLVEQGWPLPVLIGVGVALAAAGYAQLRNAWPKWLKKLDAKPPNARGVTTAWAGLLLWCAVQYGIAAWLAVAVSS